MKNSCKQSLIYHPFKYIAVTKYDIRFFNKRETLADLASWNRDVAIAVPVDPVPVDYGERQTCRVAVPWENEVFYYAVVAVDDAGNRGPISNVVSAYVYKVSTK